MKKNERQSKNNKDVMWWCDIYKLIPKIKLTIETPVLKKRSEQTFTPDLTGLNKASENTQIFS